MDPPATASLATSVAHRVTIDEGIPGAAAGAVGSKRAGVAPLRMKAVAASLYVASGVVLLAGSAAAQSPSSPFSIPLQLTTVSGGERYRLVINVGINGGTPQPYMFDTGSAPFAAAFNANTWGGAFAGQTSVPASPFANGNNVTYCYGGNSVCNTASFVGNRVQVQSLSFDGGVTLQADPGYIVTAISQLTFANTTLDFPSYFDTPGVPPPFHQTFGPVYGVFGAGNFSQGTGGGILGQTIVTGSNITQGYLVAANGQRNPASAVNPPQNADGIQVRIGGTTRNVTACSPCVTVGLTPEVLGQFALAGTPATTGGAGMVPTVAADGFHNPYVVPGTAAGNNGAQQYGTQFTISLTPSGGGTPVVATAPTMLDTGTPSNYLAAPLEQPGVATNGAVDAGVTMDVTGVQQNGGAVAGLPTSTSTMTNGTSPNTYAGTFDATTRGVRGIVGIGFFLQNSVLYDLSDNVVGYTPFFVTDAALATTAGGPLVIGAGNVPLGLAGVVSGAGGLELESGGVAQLSATNTYTGPTSIAAGARLNIAGPGSIAASSGVANAGLFDISRAWGAVAVQTLTGNGQVYLGPQALVVTNGSGTFSGTIADAGGAYDVAGGQVVVAGGRWSLTGANTYQGGTSVLNGAVLGVQADSGLGAATAGLTLNGGALAALANLTVSRPVTLGAGGGAFDSNGFDLTLAGTVSGPGALVKTGAGALVLAGTNIYGGPTVVNAGTLRLAPGAALPVLGTLQVNGGTFDAGANNFSVGALAGTGGTILLGGGTLDVDGPASTTLASVIAGTGGLAMTGGGALNLTAANTYSGPTTVSNGRLAVNGSIASNVTLGPGGTLGGTGTVFGTVSGNGILAPGNSIGTLTVSGALVQGAGSTYQVETGSGGQADRVDVAGAPGTATLGGMVSVVGASGVYAPRTTYTILNAAGGIVGAYAGATSAFPFLRPSLSYDANNVYLMLQVGGFAAQAINPVQAAVGRALDVSAPNASGDFATVLGTLATATAGQGQAAMTALSGNNYAGFSSAMVQGAQLAMSGFVAQTGGGGGLAGSTRVALAEACDIACDASRPAWGAWGGALGGLGTIGAGQGTGAVTYNAGGFLAGLDRAVGASVRVGAMAGYTSGSQWVSGFSGMGATDTFLAGLYASYAPDRFYIDALAGYAYSDNQMWRTIQLAGLASRTARGRTGANQWYGMMEAGYRVDLLERETASAFATPFVRLQGYTATQNAFTETGAQSLDLTVAQQTTNSLRSILGVQLGGAFDMGWRDRLALQVRLGWSHEFASTARPVTATLAGAPAAPFTTYGVAPQRDGAFLGFGASTAIGEATSLFLRYEADLAGADSAHALTAGFRMSW